jgi:phage shock protein C
MEKYTRSTKNSYIGGVCGGLSNSTEVDAIFWRLLFVLMPGSLLIYLVMWIFTESNENE